MKGNLFRDYKKIYTDITVPDAEIEQKWQRLSDILPEQDLPKSSYHFMPYGAVFLSAVLVLLVGTIGLAQASKPGSLLYPVNILTQEVAKNISKTFEPENHAVAPSKIHAPLTGITKFPTPSSNPTITPTIQPTKKEDSDHKFKNDTTNEPTKKVLGTQTEENDHGNSDNSHPSNSQKNNNSANKGDNSDDSHRNNNTNSNKNNGND